MMKEMKNLENVSMEYKVMKKQLEEADIQKKVIHEKYKESMKKMDEVVNDNQHINRFYNNDVSNLDRAQKKTIDKLEAMDQYSDELKTKSVIEVREANDLINQLTNRN